MMRQELRDTIAALMKRIEDGKAARVELQELRSALTPRRRKRGDTLVAELRNELRKYAGGCAPNIAQLAHQLRRPPRSITAELARLAKDGEIHRVSSGRYAVPGETC